MSLTRYVAIVAFLAAVIGFVLLFTPVSTSVAGKCGTVADPNILGAEVYATYTGRGGVAESCDDALTTRQSWAFGLIGVGLVVGVGAVVPSRTRPARHTS